MSDRSAEASRELHRVRRDLADRIALAKRFGRELVKIGQALTTEWSIPRCRDAEEEDQRILGELKDMLASSFGSRSLFGKLLLEIGHLRTREELLTRKALGNQHGRAFPKASD